MHGVLLYCSGYQNSLFFWIITRLSKATCILMLGFLILNLFGIVVKLR